MKSIKQEVFLLVSLFGFWLQSTSSVFVEVVPSPFSVNGEGPHWDIKTQSLYYVDILGNKSKVLRYDYRENKTYGAIIENEHLASFITPVEGRPRQFVVGLNSRVGIIHWDGKSLVAKLIQVLFEVDQDSRLQTRLNDAKADPFGRLYAGTMRLDECSPHSPSINGNFYMYNRQTRSADILIPNVGISNGLTWNLRKRTFYYIDSCAYNIMEYQYDPRTGAIGKFNSKESLLLDKYGNVVLLTANPRILIDLKINGKIPNFVADGMTIDQDGNLYVATFSGSKILKIDTKIGSIVAEVHLPAKQITSVAFGGPNLDILYVTSAAYNKSGPQPPLAGSVFQIKGLGRGLPMSKVRLY